MAAIQIDIKGHGNVPDETVATFRACVQALVDAGAAVDFPFRVDFSPAEDPVPAVSEVLTAPPPPAVPDPPAPPDTAALERPQPRRAVPAPLVAKDQENKEAQ